AGWTLSIANTRELARGMEDRQREVHRRARAYHPSIAIRRAGNGEAFGQDATPLVNAKRNQGQGNRGYRSARTTMWTPARLGALLGMQPGVMFCIRHLR